MIVLGLTGSIGMGKSTTAQMFAAEGIPVYDADRAVHMLYRGRAVDPVEAAFPGVTVENEVQRARVLERDGMTVARFEGILAKQMPDAEKRRRAHFLIDTGHGLEPAERAVRAILGAVAFMSGTTARAPL